MTDKKYPSDLTDEEWEIIKEILNQEEKSLLGRPMKVELRRIWDAINYINKTGCQWAYLPHDFPPYTTVNYHYMKWTKSGFFEHVNHEIRRRLRKKTVEKKNPLRVLSIAKQSKEPQNLRKSLGLMEVNASKVESAIL
jgi:putative transposase